MKTIKLTKRLSRLLALALACLALPLSAAHADVAECPPIDTGVREIQKYGNLVLEISGDTLMDLGYEYGDLIRVTAAGVTMTMPICRDLSDVDVGANLCIVGVHQVTGESLVILVENGGDMATRLGLGTLTSIEEEPGFRWDLAEGFEDDIPITISLAEKGAYLDQLELHALEMSLEREDYPQLTDEEFANFRAVDTTGMGKNVLYRSSSPINPKYARNTQADTAVNAAGIRTVVNMADNESSAKRFEGYAQTYYSDLDVIFLDLIADYDSDPFLEGLAEGCRFIAEHEGPYLIHCTLGKDRAGFFCGVLECLMGASADEVVEDYMVSYTNLYGTLPGTEKYESIADNSIQTLAEAFEIESIYDADLTDCAEAYLLRIGVSQAQIEALKARLSTDIL